MNDGILPYHSEYEEGVLGAVICEPRLYEDVSARLNYMDFYAERHQWIFAVIGEMIEGGIPLELVTLRQRLEDTGELDNAGGSGYLAYLAGNAFFEENLGYYVGVIKEDSLMRSVWKRGAELMKAVEKKEGWEKIDGIIEKLSGAHVEERGDNPVPVSARDLADIPPPPSLWADIIYPGCIVQLNSEPGAGKSTLAYNICALGASGKPFLDIPFSKRLKSLYVDLETPQFLRKNKIELICGELPADFYVIDNIELRKDFNHLLRLCKRGRYDLLVLDTQSRVLAMEKENDNSEANYLAGLLRRIANEAGCAILLIHHSTKGEEGKAVYRGRGASAIAGAVDVVVNLDALSDDTLRLSVVKHRIQGSNPKLLLRKSGEDRFEPCPDQGGGDEPGFALYRAQDAALALLSQSLTPMRTGEIAEAVEKETGVNRKTVNRALSRLAQAGKIRKSKKGHYEIRREL
jgi:DNA-binding transcriptional ArsR family regulator